MNYLRSIKKVHIAIIVFVITSFFAIHLVQAVTAEPGTGEDPVVAQSYVDSRINELNITINSLNKNITELKQQLQDVQYPKFEVLEEVQPGKQIICGASTELILRGGTAVAIASDKGGLSDLISGEDITMGKNVALNHLILIPRDDGRGVKVTKTAWILIKGPYTIK